MSREDLDAFDEALEAGLPAREILAALTARMKQLRATKTGDTIRLAVHVTRGGQVTDLRLGKEDRIPLTPAEDGAQT